MSEQEIHVGVIQLVPKKHGENDVDYFKRVTGKDYDYNLHESLYSNNLEDDYMVCNNTLYKILEDKELEGCDYCNLTMLEDNKISFATSFYNGGTCLSEMIEEKLKNATNGI